ncbi:HD domain-containing phosphohydrolase [Desulfosporosinus sp. FKA]|uniref:HD domain-containing phosphohydrolase n=1 Tax=Desulfosporosinus sp. FKA TaxID=1969834 RepID=UPI000B4971D5|nr:HD domain-containing phosphohydrolase [Desulfosporosinus sp. FKA]
MDKHLKGTPIFVSAIIGLSCLVFFLDNLRIHTVYHAFLGVCQLTILVITIFYFRYYIEKVNKERSNEFNELDQLNRLLIDVTPTGIVLINNDGIIKYVNKAAGNILGSTKTAGLNILEFDTVKKSNLYGGIVKATKGIYSEVLGERYTSFTTRTKKVLNFYVSPVMAENTQGISHTILFIHDITQEGKLKEEIEKTYLSTIEALVGLVDARDKYTGEHSKNVSKYTMMLCTELGITDGEELRNIELAAHFHDIGKIGVSDQILNKPVSLNDAEYDQMKKHSSVGADIIRKIEGFEEISEIIRHHHERWDGKGYPSNLSGNDIPYGSQIIAVADTYDALTSDRVYRKGMPKEVALKIIFEEKGRQFNQEIVENFVSMMARASVERIY